MALALLLIVPPLPHSSSTWTLFSDHPAACHISAQASPSFWSAFLFLLHLPKAEPLSRPPPRISSSVSLAEPTQRKTLPPSTPDTAPQTFTAMLPPTERQWHCVPSSNCSFILPPTKDWVVLILPWDKGHKDKQGSFCPQGAACRRWNRPVSKSNTECRCVSLAFSAILYLQEKLNKC